MSFDDLLKALLGQLGLLVALLFILWAGSRGYWVFGWYAAEQRRRIEKMEQRLDRAAGIADRGTRLAARATKYAEGQLSEAPDD